MKPKYYKVMWHNCNRCRAHYTSEHPHLKAYLCDDCWKALPHFVAKVPAYTTRRKKATKEYSWKDIALYTIGNLCCLTVIAYYLWFK